MEQEEEQEEQEAPEYQRIRITFRRKFPHAYPGFNGRRYFDHNWHVRRMDRHFYYHICRYCFDIRKQSSRYLREKHVYTGLCPSCRVDSLISRHYWDNVYIALCSSPILGERSKKLFYKKLARVGLHCSNLGMVVLPSRDGVPEKVRDISGVKSYVSLSTEDSESLSVQTL